MTSSSYADRVNLYHLMQRHPDWPPSHFAQSLKRSVSWVKKWRRRLLDAPADPAALQLILQGKSHAPKHPPAHIEPAVEEALLAIRDQPPEGLRRTAGPKAIHYDLARDPSLQLFQLPVPGTRTIYAVLMLWRRGMCWIWGHPSCSMLMCEPISPSKPPWNVWSRVFKSMAFLTPLRWIAIRAGSVMLAQVISPRR
jgi:hypothetical protein